MKNIFKNAYEKQSYTKFLQHHFLPDDFEVLEEDITDNITFKLNLTNKITKLGQVSSLDLSIYEIHYNSSSDPRVSLSREAFKILELFSVSKALVLFISEDKNIYRLSLVTIDYKLKGKGVEKQISNPRRYSYLLGLNAKMHTTEEYLIKKGRVKDFNDLLTRFSIEAVNEDFYKEISHLFFKLSGTYVKDKNQVTETAGIIRLPLDAKEGYIKTKEFCVRLIGRIIFCWFLKKKTSENGTPLIPENIFSLEMVEKKDYYHSVLEKLFFEVLNKKLQDRTIRTDDKIQWDIIPFLNGGLFDPNSHTDFYETGNPNYAVKIPDEWFSDLFQMLNLYNFTIDENTPVDIELSIDPEMLGRIFENLLAEINPETSESARKATGSFYTPRPVVEYMVNETLKKYINQKTNISEDRISQLFDYSLEDTDLNPTEKGKTIDALDDLKILDPACGSGAFPMGALQKILLILQKIDPKSEMWFQKILDKIPNKAVKESIAEKLKNENWNFKHKMGIIQDCIYGVDIQPMAIEISKLRFFLTLVVEEKIEDNQENRGINPLPNLAFKFVTANTLIGLSDEDKIDKNYLTRKREYETIIEDYFNASSTEDKEQVFRKMDDFKKKLREIYIPTKATQLDIFGNHQTTATQLDIFENDKIPKFLNKILSWDPFKDEQYNWFDPKWMFGVFNGFDIVIGNPPYVQLQKLKNSPLQKAYKEEKYEVYDSMGDIYCLFYEKGIKLLKDNGLICLITSNKWMRAGYGQRLREYFIKYNPITLIDLGPGVFKSATVDTNILLIERNSNQNNLKALTYYSDLISIEQAMLSDSVNLNKLSKDAWFIGSNAEISLKEKIEKIGKPLKDWDVNIYRGVLTGLNEAFIIDTPTKERLCIEDPNSADIIKPILRGRDIKRYGYKWAGLWIIATGYDLDIPNLYPAVYNHLLQYEEKAKKRDDQGKNWWNLRACKYYHEFEKEKIAFKAVGRNLTFSLLEKGNFLTAPASFMTSRKNLFFLSFLCSSFTKYFIYNNSDRTGAGDIMLNVQSFEKIPIPPITSSNQHIVNRIEKLAEEILELKKDNIDADTTHQERAIDLLVYQLYDLTEDEIALIEK